MAEDCREHGANHGIIGVRTELGPIGGPSGLRCLCIVLGFEFTLGTPNRKASWLVCVGLRRLPSRSESWELVSHGGHPRATMTEAVPSTRLARLLDRQVDHDNPDGGSGCRRQHRHPQFAVPQALRQPPAGPHRHGPAGAIRCLWHALRVDHETRYRLWPAHPAAMPRRAGPADAGGQSVVHIPVRQPARRPWNTAVPWAAKSPSCGQVRLAYRGRVSDASDR